MCVERVNRTAVAMKGYIYIYRTAMVQCNHEVNISMVVFHSENFPNCAFGVLLQLRIKFPLPKSLSVVSQI